VLLEEDPRSDSRQSRVLPAFLVPFEDGTACCDECSFAITKNLSDHGLSLILHQPFHAREVVIGLWPVPFERAGSPCDPLFVLGELVENVDLGGGFWQLCLVLTRLLDDQEQIDRLTPFAAKLIPAHNADHAARDQALCESLRR
jgi:hypothetical protein